MTSLPLLLGALLLLGGLLWGRRVVFSASSALVFLSALLARLLWVPVHRHQYDGHEADALSWFLGERSPGAADTLSYPLLQWWWWLLGLALPPDERLPVWISAVVGAAGVVILSSAVCTWAGTRAGLAAGLLLAAHPTHAAWSSSAYNVILPHTLGMLSVCLVSMAARERSDGLLWAAAGAGVLAISGRIETIVYALPCAVLLSRCSPWRRTVLPSLSGVLLGIWGVWPVLSAGPLPGSEERWQSLWMNLPLLVFHAPLDGLLSLSALCILAAGAWRRDRGLTLVMLAFAVVNHVLMSSFDDYGARHTLPALVSVAWLVGGGVCGLGRLGVLCWLVLLVSFGQGMADLRQRYYAEEEVFIEVMSSQPWSSLPRVSARPGREEGCGWIAEDPRVADVPARSHFNLLSAAEVDTLRGEAGCLYWCLDTQDWRWSSRGVRNRALRLDRVYILHSRSVLEHPSGYSCLVMWVGDRGSSVWPLATGWHGRGHPTDSRLP